MEHVPRLSWRAELPLLSSSFIYLLLQNMKWAFGRGGTINDQSQKFKMPVSQWCSTHKNRVKMLKDLWPISKITPGHCNISILTPQGPHQEPRWPKMDVRVINWGILMHEQFLYNFWEFLQFFPELCDTRGPLGDPKGPREGPPNWLPHTGTPQQ